MKRACRPPILPNKRRGVSIIELMVVIAISSFLLATGIGLIHLLMRVERDGIKNVWHGRSLSRLADAWHTDVRAAEDARLDDGTPETPRAILRRPGGLEVTYAVDGHAVSRVASRGDAVQQRDAFYFPPGSMIHFEIDEGPRFARIMIRRPARAEYGTQRPEQQPAAPQSAKPDPEPTMGRATTLEALLSRDLRYGLQEASP